MYWGHCRMRGLPATCTALSCPACLRGPPHNHRTPRALPCVLSPSPTARASPPPPQDRLLPPSSPPSAPAAPACHRLAHTCLCRQLPRPHLHLHPCLHPCHLPRRRPACQRQRCAGRRRLCRQAARHDGPAPLCPASCTGLRHPEPHAMLPAGFVNGLQVGGSRAWGALVRVRGLR